MKTKLATLAILAAILLAAIACAPASGQTAVVISCDEFAKQAAMTREIHVPAGSTLNVTLCSNGTTGFSWEEAKVADAAVLEQASHEIKEPASNAMGAPGSEVWSFKALKKGTTAASFAYSRSWEGGEKGVWTLELTVVVD